jgi:hypothetical protein
MFETNNNERGISCDVFTVLETARTRHAELMLLCARIGYSPPELTV